MIPNPDTYCEIDPTVVDKWGIPVLRFHFKWSDHELKMAKDMQETFRSIVEAAGGTVVDNASAQDAGVKKPAISHKESTVWHLRRAERSFTNWEQCGWAMIPRPRR